MNSKRFLVKENRSFNRVIRYFLINPDLFSQMTQGQISLKTQGSNFLSSNLSPLSLQIYNRSLSLWHVMAVHVSLLNGCTFLFATNHSVIKLIASFLRFIRNLWSTIESFRYFDHYTHFIACTVIILLFSIYIILCKQFEINEPLNQGLHMVSN